MIAEMWEGPRHHASKKAKSRLLKYMPADRYKFFLIQTTFDKNVLFFRITAQIRDFCVFLHITITFFIFRAQ